MYLYYTSFIA